MFNLSDVWRWLFGDGKDESGHWLGLLIIILIIIFLFGCESYESFLNGRVQQEESREQMENSIDEVDMQKEAIREGEVLGEQVEREAVEGELHIDGEAGSTRVYEYTGGWSETLDGEFLQHTFSATVFPGDVASLDIAAKNIGAQTWELSDRVSVNVIGGSFINSWAHTTSWLTDLRPDEADIIVSPNEVYTFVVDVQAPTVPGVYALPLMLSHDVGAPQFVRFDNGEAVITITVVAQNTGDGAGKENVDQENNKGQVLGEQIFRPETPSGPTGGSGSSGGTISYIGGSSGSGSGGGSSSGGGGSSSGGGGGSEEGDNEETAMLALVVPSETPHTTSTETIVLSGTLDNVVEIVVNNVTATASAVISNTAWEIPVTLDSDTTNTFDIYGVSATGVVSNVLVVEIVHATAVSPEENPSITQSVIITEIAWMGTDASANDEWMEISNVSDGDVDITGYVLQWGYDSALGTYSYSYTFPEGTILSAGATRIVERTDESPVHDVTSTHIYTGALGNNGDRVQLLDASSVLLDEVDATGGWFAGINGEPNYTMVRNATQTEVDNGTVATSSLGWCTWGSCPEGNVLEGARSGHDANNDEIQGSPGGIGLRNDDGEDNSDGNAEPTCEETESCESENSTTPTAMIHFQKVVCEREADLPNGKKNVVITSTTAQDFVNNSGGGCYFAEGWSFQWKKGKKSLNAGLDVYGEVANWNTVGPTDATGSYTSTIDITNIKHISVREVLQDKYIPFTYWANGKKNIDDVTAEFYCSDGAGNNYDNLAWLQNLKDGDHRYCVAFNALQSELTTYDYGDAPEGYSTTFAGNGARHVVTESLYFGSFVDVDEDGLPSVFADGDNITGEDDEDGVRFIVNGLSCPGVLSEECTMVAGETYVVEVLAVGEGNVFAWIDFDADGSFDDPRDRIIDGASIANEEKSFEFTVPEDANTDEAEWTYARFRLTTEQEVFPFGKVIDGEVEDYLVAIAPIEENMYPYGEILSPEDGSTVYGTFVLTAKYYDGDTENDDIVQWAVRAGTCAAGIGTMHGNVDGHNDSYSWDGMNFSAEIPNGTLANGMYCFVFNPSDDGDVNVRETSEFTLENEVVEEPEILHEVCTPEDSDECALQTIEQPE